MNKEGEDFYWFVQRRRKQKEVWIPGSNKKIYMNRKDAEDAIKHFEQSWQGRYFIFRIITLEVSSISRFETFYDNQINENEQLEVNSDSKKRLTSGIASCTNISCGCRVCNLLSLTNKAVASFIKLCCSFINRK